MAAITLDRVGKTYRGGVQALRDVTLAIPDGAFWAIVGAEGAGKSTLLRLVGGREAPTVGFATVWNGGDRRGAALTAGTGVLSSYRTVYAEMEAAMRPERPTAAEAEARTLAVADALGLAPLLGRRLGALSDGERRTVAFARTIVRRPGAYLFDEPFADAGPSRRDLLRDALTRLRCETGVTTVLATRNPADALRLAEHVVVLVAGEIAATGAPRALYEAPESLAVARALSAFGLNVLPVRANQTGLSLDDGTWLDGASVMTRSTYASLAVRPEHLFVPDANAAPPAARLPMIVSAIETAGGEVILNGRVGPHPVTARLAWAPDGLTPGATLVLGARRAHLHMFDVATDRRL